MHETLDTTPKSAYSHVAMQVQYDEDLDRIFKVERTGE